MRPSIAQLKASLLLLGAFAFAGSLACGGDDGETSDGDGTESTSASTGGTGETGTADGVTDCTPPGLDEVVCQAGQYCADSVLGQCENGCLSNDNCTSEQVCDKADGENVGSCQNTEDTGSGPTEEEFCDKLLTCDMTGTMEQCSLIYTGTNEGCHQCIIDGNCGDVNNGSCDADCGF